MVEDTLDHTKAMDPLKGDYKPGDIRLEEALERVKMLADGIEINARSIRRGEVRVDPKLKDLVLKALKEMGFDHFVMLTCVDLIEEKKIELVYHLWSYGTKGLIMVKTGIGRDEPSIGTVVPIFRAAITYEREIREMFGVDFPGNPRLTQFILEDWEGPPPMRKDFNAMQYSVDRFDMKIRYPKSLPTHLLKKEDD
ncbi:MAG: NADH-quinone oxidoreductase subunit C [Thermoplasmatota archaeon]